MDAKLLTLIELSKVNSFTKAAKELNLTQPAVSQHIKQLEEEFGKKNKESIYSIYLVKRIDNK